MNIKPRFTQHQSLKLSLNPKLIQMFNIFHLSYADLVDHIQQEQQDNVFIDVSQPDRLMTTTLSKSSSRTESDNHLSDTIANLDYQSIREFALSQLNYCSATAIQKQIISLLIDSLDDTGFISNWKSVSKHIQTSLSVSSTVVNKCLLLLQEFEPDGIGARSLSECLEIQINHLDLDDESLSSLLIKVTQSHLEDLANQHYESIASSCNIPLKGVSPLADFIKSHLNPNPGSMFDSNITPYITPSFRLSYNDGAVVIQNLEIDKGISISLSETYLETLNSKDIDKESKQFLTEKYHKAKDMIQFINQRRDMLDSLMSYIANKQILYFQKGPDYLVPLLQKDVASDLSLSPSTVSRILSSKFCETNFGTIPLNILCPRNYFGKTKDQFTTFIAYYLKTYPHLSDQKICLLLNDKGIPIARRTVTKYRHQLGLVSSYFKGRSSD